MATLTEVSRHYSVAAGCDALYRVDDPVVGLVGFIAVHELRAGRAVGGIRRLPYASAREAVEDAVRLAEQMTLKTAFAELPVGGAKSVVIDREGLDLERAYKALGAAVTVLDGAYFCGQDVGTGTEQLAWVRSTTDFVNHPGNHPSASTALGVLMGLDAALAFTGRAGKPFAALVQGCGSVGALVADGLAERGGTLTVTDIEPDRVESVLSRHASARSVAAEAALDQETEILVPCALGPVVTAANVQTLRCVVICGGANNQLEDPALAHALMRRDVVYVPEFAINAGGVIEGVLVQLLGDDAAVRGVIDEAIRSTGPRVTSVLEEARDTGITPLEAALGRLDRD